MLFRNGAKSQITSALSSTGFRSKSSPREKSPTRKEACVTLNGEMSFSPDVQHTDLEVLSNSKGKRFKKVQLRDGNDTLGRLASVWALSQRQEASRVRTTSTSHTIGSAYDGGPARSSKLRGSEHVLLWSPRTRDLL
ncbi:hypothetical protein MCOR34_006174 [Pyricularia oryzae]|nr:hypothetical protein MCOR34_006174 [Pyricularia oryzae]